MFKSHLSAFLNILYPKNCHICSRIFDRHTAAYDDNICAPCYSTMRKTVPETSQPPLSTSYERLLACYHYEGAVRELIHKFKYDSRPYLAETIAKLMRETLNEAGDSLFADVDCFVPIPLYPARAREREFNQSELLARILSTHHRKPCSLILRRNKNTRPQATLPEHERRKNIQGAFGLNYMPVKNKNIALIDDVVTTTATVQEAAQTLKKAGAKKVWVLAFAKG